MELESTGIGSLRNPGDRENRRPRSRPERAAPLPMRRSRRPVPDRRRRTPAPRRQPCQARPPIAATDRLIADGLWTSLSKFTGVRRSRSEFELRWFSGPCGTDLTARSHISLQRFLRALDVGVGCPDRPVPEPVSGAWRTAGDQVPAIDCPDQDGLGEILGVGAPSGAAAGTTPCWWGGLANDAAATPGCSVALGLSRACEGCRQGPQGKPGGLPAGGDFRPGGTSDRGDLRPAGSPAGGGAWRGRLVRSTGRRSREGTLIRPALGRG